MSCVQQASGLPQMAAPTEPVPQAAESLKESQALAARGGAAAASTAVEPRQLSSAAAALLAKDRTRTLARLRTLRGTHMRRPSRARDRGASGDALAA